MKLTKILLLIFIFSGLELACSVAHAEIQLDTLSSAGWEKLTPDQQADIVKRITASTQATTKNDDTVTPKVINEWVSMGENLGKALGGAAKELGIQANEFAKTPLGLISVSLIIWHFMGEMLIHVFGSIVILAAITLFIKWHKNQIQDSCIEYNTEKTNFFGNHPVKHIKYEISDSWKETYMIIWCLGVILSLIVMFTY